MKHKLLPARIHVGRLMGAGPDVMRLEVVDESSGISFLEINLTPGDLMLSLTGRNVECKMEVRGLRLVGMKSEHKTEEVEFSMWDTRAEREGLDDDQSSPATVKALKKFEVDGWRGRVSDLFNGHRTVRDKDPKKPSRQSVNFYRFVNPETGKPVE
jgi:hypothetical protein